MKRWNGWGDASTSLSLPSSAVKFLAEHLGPGCREADAGLEKVVARVPPSALSGHAALDVSEETRLRHARGQSLPDWIALRSGEIGAFPDAVTLPNSEEEIRDIYALGSSEKIAVIPYGGGTSVVGHINPLKSERPVLTVNLRRMNQLLDLDTESGLATFQAGVTGPEIESALQPRGYTLGHFPQSWELSTLGGWIATRSCGQQSLRYGRIEDLFAGGLVQAPAGEIRLEANPASAAGPDIRELILGSEGRFGIITSAIVRVTPLPEIEYFGAVFFRNFEAGLRAVREIAREKGATSLLRLSDAQETETTLMLSGGGSRVRAAMAGLQLLGHGPDRCLLIYGLTGSNHAVECTRHQIISIARSFGGLSVGSYIGQQWRTSRFQTPYLRNTLWDHGYALDTLETAVPWSRVNSLCRNLKDAIRDSFSDSGVPVLSFTHISHVYQDGASTYLTYIFPRQDSPKDTLFCWKKAKDAASRCIREMEGTISHQHGIGWDHRPFFESEVGVLGVQSIEAVREKLDPQGMLNPGKMIPARQQV